MRDSGKTSAAIEVLEMIERAHRPAKVALKAWGGEHRFAGAKDRAWISGLVLDALRHRRSLAWRMGDDAPRAAVLGCLGFAWSWDLDQIVEAAAEEPHGPGALSAEERAALTNPRDLDDAPSAVQGDYPDWLEPQMTRVFGDARLQEAQALAARAPVDLRVNALKTDVDRARKALASVKPVDAGFLTNALRLPANDPRERQGHVMSIPAYSKGWVEVQDLGSQVAAAAAGAIAGKQVLDYCAGGGGKTLALAALMGNTGQIYAYDADARRLSPLIARAQRAGVRNLQLRTPTEPAPLDDLVGKMDVVFVDAPCTGSGVWRRQPDSKWRLKPTQLEKRTAEQDAVLAEAAAYVKPGGRLVYVTCSLFAEENEDRISAFLAAHAEFAQSSAVDAIAESGLATEEGLAALRALENATGALRLTPRAAETDGFFVAALARV
ncbi:MAG: RsmB/NOP family class I SAM-dependent RNA methyltransferase [Maricaulaceae bacterium]